MTRYLIITTLLTVLVLTSCKEDDVNPPIPDYIIFGHFYGECFGEECIQIFRLEKDKLFEDTNDQYPNPTDFYVGNWVQLSQQKFDETKDLTSSFPTDLLNETNTVIGQPDAGDWGGLYVEYSADGLRKFWLLDQMKSNVPTKYHNFIDIINQKIAQLK